jgi:uncharacterized protein (DUF2267 family)
MEFERLIEQVRHEAEIVSGAEAEAGLDTALERLGERLTPEQAQALGERLPSPAGEILNRRVGREDPGGGMPTLVEEVAAAAGIRPRDAERLVRATLHALAAAVAPDGLPPPLAALLDETVERPL